MKQRSSACRVRCVRFCGTLARVGRENERGCSGTPLPRIWSLWAPTGASAVAPHAYGAEYKGDYSFSDHIADPQGDYLRIDETYTWDVHVYTEVAADGSSTSTKTMVAQGSYTQAQQQGESFMPPPPPTSFTCTITQLQTGAPNLSAFTVSPGFRPGTVGVGALLPEDAGTQLTVTGSSQCPGYGSVLFSNTETDGTAWTPFPPGSQSLQFKDAFAPTVQDVPEGGYVKHYDVDQPNITSPKGTSTETVSRSLHAILSTLGAGQVPPPSPPADRKKKKQEEASAEFRKAGLDALVPCAKTLKETVAKTIEMSTVAGEAFELSINALQPFVAAALGGDPAKEANECAEAIVRMIEAYEKYNSTDPPDSAFMNVALPAARNPPRSGLCARQPGKAARICRDLVGALARRRPSRLGARAAV